MILTGKQISDQKIVEQMIDPGKQIQPCGIDLTVGKIELLTNRGSIDFDNTGRILPNTLELVDSQFGMWTDGSHCLGQGCYLVTFNEIVNVPKNCMGIARPRSSLLRCGASVETSVWDPGYRGRSQSLLTIHNQCGLMLKKNAKLIQIVFMTLSDDAEQLYNGIYQNENIE